MLRAGHLCDAAVMPGTRIGSHALLTMLGDWTAGPGASLQVRLADSLRQTIETGVLPPGSILPAERSLARDLSVSRSTVTAALSVLKAEGTLESRQGSGTVVVGPPTLAAPGATVLPGILGARRGIDLAASTPADARALPVVDVDLEALLRSGPRHGYSPEGLPALRHAVAERFTMQGLVSSLDEIVITNGAQHALALALTLLAQPGDAVIVDDPTYPGMIDLLASRRLTPIPLARTEGRIDVTGLRQLVATHDVSIAYLQTGVHNPTGFAAQDWELNDLAAACDELGLTVLEDLVLADLRFDGATIQPLASRVSAASVLVIGSISKLGWGGLRIGWLRAPQTLIERLLRARLTDDLGSSVPSQVIAAGVLTKFDDVVASRQPTLQARATLARSLLHELVPSWQPEQPEGGLSLWIELPTPSAEALSQQAVRHGVTVATGGSAVVDGDGASFVRLCFDRPESQLREGIRRLAEAWEALS